MISIAYHDDSAVREAAPRRDVSPAGIAGLVFLEELRYIAVACVQKAIHQILAADPSKVANDGGLICTYGAAAGRGLS